MSPEPDDLQQILERASRGDRDALGPVLDGYRDRLRRMVRLRLDARIRARVDASDVVQEACFEASRRCGEWLRQQDVPFYLWLRFLTGQQILMCERRHLGAQARDVRREARPGLGGFPGADVTTVVEEVVANATSPTKALARKEVRAIVERALAQMEEIDREVLVLRHFEQLSNAEAAQELGIAEEAARKRYFRAAGRLREILEGSPGIGP